MNQEHYGCSVRYEFDGKDQFQIIKQTVVHNFVFPCWAEQYSTVVAPPENMMPHEEGMEPLPSKSEEPSVEKERQCYPPEGIEKHASVVNKLKILDVRSFIVDQTKQKKYDFYAEDKKDFKELERIGDSNPAQKEYDKTVSPEKSEKIKQDQKFVKRYIRKAQLLSKQWRQFMAALVELLNSRVERQSVYQKLQTRLLQQKGTQCYIFKRTQTDRNNDKIEGSAYFLIRSGQFNEEKDKYTERDIVIPWSKEGGLKMQKASELSFQLTFLQQELNAENKERYYKIVENSNVKVLKILIKIGDPHNFLKEIGTSKETLLPDRYYWIESVINRNRVVYPYQEPNFQRSRVYLGDHFHLAFQGGGAKGLAYVGAYKAIRQFQEGKDIPIKSIMGSSAGGIIALAISTGIPEYELQKICYKMNQIPSKDRISRDTPNLQALDDYGNQILQQDILENLLRIFDELGIIEKQSLRNLLSTIFKDETLKKSVQEKVLKWVSSQVPAMGEVLAQSNEEINWEGLLLHGALMEGKAIHDIASDCLVKFFVQNPEMSSKDYFDVQRELKDYYIASIRLLHIDFQIMFGDDSISASFAIGLINRVMVMLNNSLKELSQRFIICSGRQELTIANSRVARINLGVDGITIPNNSFNVISLMSYLMTCFNDLPPDNQQSTQVFTFLDGISWEELKGLLKSPCFLLPNHFTKVNIAQMLRPQSKIIDFLTGIFGWQLENIIATFPQFPVGNNEQIDEFKEIIFNQFRLLTADKRFNILEIASAVRQLYNSISQNDRNHNQRKEFHIKILEYDTAYKALQRKVQGITMQQYYRMTKIELSCTSVDLDSKVLRFFNHKTTPALPVCKAVQMTGSFPVGFKALKWKQEWGKYQVHLQQKKMQIDISGHEFTDGGLLANFPIKYMDNQTMRKIYFSNKSIEGLTILLGFGLDNLSPERYEKTAKQAQTEKRQRCESEKSLSDLKDMLGTGQMIKLALSAINQTSGKKIEYHWTDLQHSLTREIPLLRFLLKIYEAYPNADRNLNLEAFQNKIFKQQLQNQWLMDQDFKQNERASGKTFLKQFMYEYKYHIKPQINVVPVAANQPQHDLLVAQVRDRFSRRKLQNQGRIRILRQSFEHSLTNNQNKKLFHPNNIILELQQTTIGFLLKELNLKLIRIFYTHLKMPCNKKVTEKYNKMYTLLKFLALDNDFYNDLDRQRVIETNKDHKLTFHLNRMSFSALFEEQDYEEISKHLGFFQYQIKFYKQFSKSFQEMQGNSFEDKYRSYCQIKKEKDFATLDRYSGHNFATRALGAVDYDFVDMQLFDVTEDIRRVVQMIYLMIKGRLNNHQLNPRLNMERLIEYVKSIDYRDLLDVEKGGLTLEQILKFFKQETTIMGRELTLTKCFKDLISLITYNGNNNIDIASFEQGFLKDFLKTILTRHCDSAQSELANQDENFSKWYKSDYHFIRNCDQRVQLKQIMKNILQNDIDQYTNKRNVYQRQQQQNQNNIFFKRWINKAIDWMKYDLRDITSLTSRMVYLLLFGQMPPKGTDVKHLIQIDEFVLFVLSNQLQWNYTCHLSSQRRQKINRSKNKVIEILFFFIKNYFDVQDNKQMQNAPVITPFDGIKFTTNIVQPRQFVRDGVTFLRGQINDIQNHPLNIPLHGNLNETSSILLHSLSMIEMDSIRSSLNSRLTIQTTSQKKEEESTVSFYSSDNRELVNVIDERLKKEEEINEKYYKNLKNIHDSYYQHMQFIFQSLREFIIIASGIEDDFIPQIYQKISATYDDMFKDFLWRYHSLSELPINIINEANLGETFIISYKHIESIYRDAYYEIKQTITRYEESQPGEPLNLLRGNNLPTIKMLEMILFRINAKKTCLPLADVDWKISSQRFDQKGKKEVLGIIRNRSDNNSQKQGVHLIFEGVKNANEYLGGLYQSIKSIFEDVKKGNKEIKMITCSNYHSIFGLLLSMKYSQETIRKEMFKLQFIVNQADSQYEATKYLDDYTWAKKTPAKEKELLSYLQKEHLSFFERVELLKYKKYQNHSLTEDFKQVRLLFESEKIKMMKTYELILEETAKEISTIRDNNHSSLYPLEISKKFGLNYICELERSYHKYPEGVQKSFESFKDIAVIFYDTFGHLLTGIISSALVDNCRININNDNASDIVKAVLVKRLLTTFKLKEYIIQKLQQAKLSPSITLSEFYQASERSIFLNFTVIDINRQRLTILNRNTTPNMPIWAAIIASSSLPFLHNFFEASKEWQTPDIRSFSEFFLQEFFKAEPDSNSRTTRFLSGNFISSLPLELLTNDTIKRKLFLLQQKLDENEKRELLNLVDYAICFDSSQNARKVVDLKLVKHYVNVSVGKVMQQAGSKTKQKASGVVNWFWDKVPVLGKNGPHYNNRYEIPEDRLTSISTYLLPWLNSTTFLTTLNTLSNSNDNFCLKWYYNKLIRLPIKLDTLQFNEIVDMPTLSQYQVNVLSEKAQEAVQRAFEITNSFIQNVHLRYLVLSQAAALELANNERIKVKFRLQIVEKAHKVTGFKRKFLKMNFLNHSKWNCNNYNNFVVEYFAEGSSDNLEKPIFQRAAESQIMFLIELNTTIFLRFFYMEGTTKKVLKKEEFKLIFIPSRRLPEGVEAVQPNNLNRQTIIKAFLKNSYDYEFSLSQASSLTLLPTKRNGQGFERAHIRFPAVQMYKEEGKQFGKDFNRFGM